MNAREPATWVPQTAACEGNGNDARRHQKPLNSVRCCHETRSGDKRERQKNDGRDEERRLAGFTMPTAASGRSRPPVYPRCYSLRTIPRTLALATRVPFLMIVTRIV